MILILFLFLAVNAIKAKEKSLCIEALVTHLKKSKRINLYKEQITLEKKKIWSEITKDMFSVEYAYKITEDPETNAPDDSFKASVIVSGDHISQIFSIKHLSEEKKYEVLESLEKNTEEYLVFVLQLNLKKEFLIIAKQYLNQRRVDLGEVKAKFKIGEANQFEVNEVLVKLKEAEIVYQSLLKDIEIYEKSIKLFLEKDDAFDVDQFLLENPITKSDIEEDICECLNELQTDENLSSDVKKEQALANRISVLHKCSLFSFFSLELSATKIDFETDDAIDAYGLSFKVNASPKKFFDLYYNTKQLEFAKFKAQHAVKKNRIDNEINIMKLAQLYEDIKLYFELMQVKKTSLNHNLALYQKGEIKYEKIVQAREEYYNVSEKYYRQYEKLVENWLRSIKTHGKLRKMLMNN